MKSPREIRYETYHDLYHAERGRREQLRGTVGIPVAALSFAVFSFVTVAENLRFERGLETIPILQSILTLAAFALLVAAAVLIFRMEWQFVYHEPPDLREVIERENQLRAKLQDRPAAEVEHEVSLQTSEILTASYYLAYERYLAGNEYSAKNRTRGLRMVLGALLCLMLAALLQPLFYSL